MIMLLIISLLYPLTQAIREAVVDNKETLNHPGKHDWFRIDRGIFYSAWAIGINAKTESMLMALLFTLAASLLFPFLHDGLYYLIRNTLSKGSKPYPKGWFSSGSTARTEKIFTPAVRTVLFALGIYLIIIILYHGIH